MKPLSPLDTTPLFAPLHDELMTLLRGLTAEDWRRPTVAGDWRVRDVAAHLLDGYLRTISVLRDDHLVPPSERIDGYRDLVGFLDRLNAEWVTASARLSPRVLVELLAATGPAMVATLSSLPPEGPARFSVAWAGEEESRNWMHVGREYTEQWHHQAQIRDAVGAPGLFEARWFRPLLGLSFRALPHAYRDVDAPVGSRVVVEVTGPGGGVWSLVRDEAAWTLFEGTADPASVVIRLDAETVWRSLYHALSPAEARARADVEGDPSLAEAFFGTRSVMV